MKGYKGFDKDLKCRGFQFEVGKEYKEDEAEVCKKGFHFCENPFDVFNYYAPSESRYCLVEGDGIDKENCGDSKVAASNLKVGVEIGLPGLIKAGVEYIKSNVDWENSKKSNTGNRSAATNTGDRSAATNTGDRSAATNTGNRSAATNTGNRSAATNTGDRSAATNTGNRSAAIVEGKESIACALGEKSKAKGKLGCWIVVAERNNGHIKCVKTALVDGEIIKEDVFYTVENGEFVEAI